MGLFVVWLLAIAMSWSGIVALRTSTFSTRFVTVSLAISILVGLFAGVLALSSAPAVTAAAMSLLLFGVTSYVIIKQAEARNRNRERIRELFDEHPEMHEKFQRHWFFGRQVQHFDEKEHKRRDR